MNKKGGITSFCCGKLVLAQGFAGVLLILSSSWVLATDVSEVAGEAVVMDNQVISSTGLLTDVDDAPIHTEVITAKQIEFMQAKVLTEALRFSPGIKVQQTVKKGSKLSMQGIDANYVLILKDGLPFVSPTGSETDLSQISLAGIDRIEIIKGSGSALYGSSAMGGVINLISKESDVSQIEIDIKRGFYQTGTDGLKQEQSLFASKVLGRSKISTQIFNKKTPEINLDDSTEAADGAQQDLTNIELRLDQRHGDELGISASSFVRLNYTQDEKIQSLNSEIYPGQGTFANEYQTKSEKTSLDAGIRQFKFNWLDQGSINFRYENYSEQSGNNDELKGELNQREVVIDLYKIETQFNNHFYHSQYQNTLSYGISAQLNQMEQNKLDGITEIDDKESSTVETYAQSHVMTANYGEFVPGLRVQHDSDFGFYSNAKLNWMKDLSLFKSVESKLRLSYGQGYRTPDLKQRFYLFDHSNLGYVIKGNEDLDPEESNNYNMTLTLKQDNTRLEWSAFYNQYRNKIETVSNGTIDNIEQYQYENVGEAITQGQELSLILHPIENMYWQQSIAYLDTENLDTGKRLEGQPKWSYKTQFNYSITQKLIMSLYGSLEYDTYNGQYDSDGDEINDTDRASVTDVIQVWDIKASYRVISEVNIYTSIDNLFNARRSINYDTVTEVDDRTIESRTLNLGMNINF